MLIRRVRDLLAEEYDIQAGERAPSAENVDRAARLLADAFSQLAGPFPRGFASTTGVGDVRIYWRVGQKSLHLILPPDVNASPALYLRAGDEESYLSHVSAQLLADSLMRFNSA